MKTIAGLILFAAFGLLSPMRAELTSKDFQSSGDHLLTLDVSHGLEWLDLTPTLNLSLSQAQGLVQDTGLFRGFRLATVNEFEDMLSSAGVSLTNFASADDEAGLARTQQLQSLLGVVDRPILLGPMMPSIGTGHYSLGYLSGIGSDTFALGRVVLYDFDSGYPRYDVTDVQVGPTLFADPVIGYYLVRSVAAAVPEPSSYAAVAGLVLAAICFTRKRRS